MAGEERALALAGEEAEVLALALGGHRQARGGGELAHLGLRQVGEREAQPLERRGSQRREHVGLVLGGVGGRGEQRALAVVDDPRVVAGREGRRRRAGRRARASRRSAARRCRPRRGSACCPRRVAAHELADDRALGRPPRGRASGAGCPSAVGERSGAEHRLGRAAASRAVVVPVGPELERDRDHLRPPLALEQRGDGGVDPAAHRHEHALAVGRPVRQRDARRGRGRRARGEARPRPGPPRGGPAGRGRRGSPIRPLRRSRAAWSACAPSASSATAAAAAVAAAQPSASKVTASMTPSAIASETRTRSPHAAPPAAPLNAPEGAGARCESSFA